VRQLNLKDVLETVDDFGSAGRGLIAWEFMLDEDAIEPLWQSTKVCCDRLAMTRPAARQCAHSHDTAGRGFVNSGGVAMTPDRLPHGRQGWGMKSGITVVPPPGVLSQEASPFPPRLVSVDCRVSPAIKLDRSEFGAAR
jgi:hypothetical protein